jgi:hypothetical protein
MHRLLFIVPLLAPLSVGLVLGCAKRFQDMRTPSGEFCSDMAVIPAGSAPDREYHRLRPISSDPETRTEAERLESLRKAACEVGGDAVIEAVNEEVRMPNATYATVSSGTAIIWTRRGNMDPTPLTVHPTTPEPGDGTEPDATASPPAPEATTSEEPEPPPPAKPIKSTTPTAAPVTPPAPEPTATATAKTAPTSTAKTAPTGTSTAKTAPAPTTSGKATFLKKK